MVTCLLEKKKREGGRGKVVRGREREGQCGGRERGDTEAGPTLEQTPLTFLFNADLHLPFHFWVFKLSSNIPFSGSEGVVRIGHSLHKACAEEKSMN